MRKKDRQKTMRIIIIAIVAIFIISIMQSFIG